MSKRIRPLLIMVLGSTLSISQAADEITDPTATPTELWHYGTGSNNQVITFSYDATALSSVTVSIVVLADPADELFSKAYFPPFTSPYSINITVPDPIDNYKACTIKVAMNPMGPVGAKTISQDVDIRKP